MVNKIELKGESIIAQLGIDPQSFKCWKGEHFLSTLKSKRFPELVGKISQPAMSNQGFCFKHCE